MRKVKIAPSLLSANFANLERDISIVQEGGADILHIDVMDGHFVPNITIGPPVVKAINEISKLPLDVHLMIEDPYQYIPDFVKAGADIISVHIEATSHINRVIQRIKSYDVKAGLALNPGTPIFLLDEILDQLDLILMMSVNPGFGGQKFIESTYDKISRVKKITGNREIEIEVDGGINLEIAKRLIENGASILVAGSSIFNSPDPRTVIKELKELSKSSI